MTGSGQAAPTSQIASQSLPPPPGTSRPATVASTGVSGGGPGMGSYTPTGAAVSAPARQLPPPAASHEVTGSIQHSAQSGWNWDGGTAIVVSPGDTAESLARKYGVPASAILRANNMTSGSAIRPGQRIVIPRYSAAAAQSAPVGAHAPATGANVHVVRSGETLMSLSRHYHKPVGQIAAANKISRQTRLRIGDRISIPGKVTVAQAATQAPAQAAAQAAPAIAAPKVQPPHAQAPVAAPKVVASLEQPTARIASAGAQATAAAGTTTTTASVAAPTFRWPVRGRVIATFGAKSGGQHNDGIDLAVPEGTAVHAAEDGVVAYAGNELKGYGNLILIRHPDGYVTAYAHASELLVKRNDQVRRGQVIAKSGQTGGVTTPQLHFEIRKGSTPVDPQHLLPAGA